MEYKQQLADSRWLKKKNEILERDNYTCLHCGRTSNLNVHHLSYEKGKLAWDYPNEKLITLCKSCHSMYHGTTKPYFGEVYSLEHSDYSDYMICYGYSNEKNRVYLMGFDSGSDWRIPIVRSVPMDYFSERYVHLNNFWDNCNYANFKDNFIQENILTYMYGFYKKKQHVFEVDGFPYPKQSVYDFLSSRIWDLANTHDDLFNVFCYILNEW